MVSAVYSSFSSVGYLTSILQKYFEHHFFYNRVKKKICAIEIFFVRLSVVPSPTTNDLEYAR